MKLVHDVSSGHTTKFQSTVNFLLLAIFYYVRIGVFITVSVFAREMLSLFRYTKNEGDF